MEFEVGKVIRNKYHFFNAVLFLVTILLIVLAIFKFVNAVSPKTQSKIIFNEYNHSKKSSFAKVNWYNDQGTLYGDIDKYLKANIIESYLDVWDLINYGIKTKDAYGYEDLFEPKLAKQLMEFVPSNKDFMLERQNLEHNIHFNFLSIDRSMISFTDERIIIASQHIDGKRKSIIKYDTLAVQVLMNLIDGRWKIYKFKSIDPVHEVEIAKSREPLKLQNDIVGINYYPRANPWHEMWSKFSIDTTVRDFKIIKELDYNTIRIFIPYSTFGGGNVTDEMLVNLERLLDIADENHLKIMPTLFDFPNGYSINEFPAYAKHLERIISKVGNHPSIIAWDIKNEPDLDFDNYGRENVLGFLDFIIDKFKRFDVNTPITVGWSDADSAHLLHDKLDFVSFHYYKEPSELGKTFRDLSASIGYKDIVLSEYGVHTSNALFAFGSHSKYSQKKIINTLENSINEIGLRHSIRWCFSDFLQIPDKVMENSRNIKLIQSSYGVLDNTLERKSYLLPESSLGFLDKVNYNYISILLLGLLYCTLLLIGFISIIKTKF